jgi:eukaryotic-like serine/threonine-protein kinase
MPLATGQIIFNRYRIAALLGQGGMGNVYRAWDVNLKIPVALKENLDASPEAQQQFSEEARLLARLSHPNLPRVTNYFTIPGLGEYLVMDYIEGEDLETMLETPASGPAKTTGLAQATVIPWIIQVCEALSYLHGQQLPVIHRDVKPANIKITPDGRAVLVDFGIAKRYDPLLSTLVGARAVTPGFSPPEQYGGASTDARSDIYALGATLYHLLTGQQPPESVQRVAGSAPSLAPRQLNPEISPAIEQIILKAMAISMDRRYQNAAEMKAALLAANAPGPAGRSLQPAAGGLPSGGHVQQPAGPRPAPVPIEPLPRRTTTAPPPPKGFLASNWPVLLLGGVALVILTLAAGRLIINGRDSKQAAAAATATASAAQSNLASLSPTSTSPIDSLMAKAEATRTAEMKMSGATIPPTPAVTPSTPNYPRHLYDRFNDNKYKWFTGIQDALACWITGGRYTCQVESGQAANHFQWLERYPLPFEFVLSADVWPGPEQPRGLGNANAGLVFRSTDQGRYLFSVRNDGYFRVSSIQSAPANWIDVIPWRQSEAIQRGQDNRLSVVGRGFHYNLFINGQYAGSFDDGLWTEGYPGLHLFTAPGEKPAIVEFDNFELRAP